MAVWALVAAAAVSAVSSIQQGEAANAAAQYNARVAEQNAVLSRQQAAEEERRQRIMARKQIGSMRANFGASGVTTAGSPLDVLEESAATAELDALTIRHAGEVNAAGFRNTARLERMKGKAALDAGYLGAASSVLKGAGNAFLSQPTSSSQDTSLRLS